MARPKRLEEILLAPPLPMPDERDLVREAERAEVMAKKVDHEAFEAITSAPPAKTARAKLAQAVDESADALASHAVDQALSATGKDAVGAVTSLLDASEQETTVMHISAADIGSLTFQQLTVAVGALRQRDEHPVIEQEARA